MIEGDKDGPSGAYYYVWLNPDMPGKARLAADLKESLDETHGTGKKEAEVAWWSFLEPPYGDWTTENTLVLLYRKAEAAEQIADQLEGYLPNRGADRRQEGATIAFRARNTTGPGTR